MSKIPDTVFYARDTAKKIKSTFKMKGESGKHLTTNPLKSVFIHDGRVGVPKQLALLLEKANLKRQTSVEKAKLDIVTLKRRDEDLDVLFKRISIGR